MKLTYVSRENYKVLFMKQGRIIGLMFNAKPHKAPTDKQVLGRIGEDYACDYLRKNGYMVIERNYLKKWGELDIVAKKGKKLHFVEVKSVSRTFLPDVTYETQNIAKGEYRPEDNMHPWKLQRLARVTQSYLLDKNIPDDVEWQFDLITVYIDINKKLHKVEFIADIIL